MPFPKKGEAWVSHDLGEVTIVTPMQLFDLFGEWETIIIYSDPLSGNRSMRITDFLTAFRPKHHYNDKKVLDDIVKAGKISKRITGATREPL